MIIKDRTFVISGGASGLGHATAKELHSHGGSIAILDLNSDLGNSAAKELGDSRARFFEVDISDTDSVASAVSSAIAWTKETGHQIGGVIAAAGIGSPGKMIDRDNEPLDLDTFDSVISINLRGSIDLCRQFLPTLTQNEPLAAAPDDERGVLVLVSSVAAYDGQPGQVAYAASKGAIASVVLPMARDLAQYGIRAVAIAPGIFESAMTKMMSKKVKASLERVMEFPKRMGTAEEFARSVREVIGNSMYNGTVIRLDGGIRMPSKM